MNTAQKEVVGHGEGPLLVVAGAGTGKTRVIVERINRLLDAGTPAKAILAVTFTEKAAAEMLERVLEARTSFEAELPIMTFNAYGESILREFNTDAGLSRNFKVLGENAKLVFLKQRLEDLQLDYFSPVSNPEGMLPDLADYFSKLKQYVITPEKYADFVKSMPASDEAENADKTKHQELARAYKNYIRLSKQENVIDYDDQIYRVIELLETRPNVKKALQIRYQFVMVDEFQDTNPMQSRMIDLLVNDQQNLMVVGDDDQSIYGFRGATLANILDFKERYPKTKEIALTENYRSDQLILDSSYKLITNNNPQRLEARLGIDKKLHAQFSNRAPEAESFATLGHELHWLASEVKARLQSGTAPGEIAVLCRRNVTAKQVSEALTLADIDHVVIGEKYQLYKAPVVRMLVEALRAVVDPTASTSLYHTLTSALFKASPSELADHSSAAKKAHLPLEEYLSSKAIETTKEACQMLGSWREEASTLSVGRLVFKIIEDSGYKDALYTEALNDEVAARAIMQLAQFFDSLKDFESIAIQPTAMQYLESYAVLEAAGETGEDGTLDVSSEKVNILTIHKSKGLEWEVVYIPDCTEGSFPMRAQSRGLIIPEQLTAQWASEADDHTAEERRLMYVATTRAKKVLYLSYSKKHRTPTPRKPSRFLNELFDTLPETKEMQDSQSIDTLLGAPTEANKGTIELPPRLKQSDGFHLSVSQITTYLNCPLDFYYRYVLNVPEPENFAASYGSAVHAAIEEFNKTKKAGTVCSVETMLEIVEENWKSAGFLSKEHELKARLQANQTINQYHQTHLNDPAPLEVEWPFNVRINDANITITGRLDVVLSHEKGTEIRDYKTSTSVTTPEKAKNRATGSSQLTLYALIWQQIHDELPANLSLEFVDTNLIGEVKKSQRGIDTMHTKLVELGKALKAKHFPPGTDHRYCRHPEV